MSCNCQMSGGTKLPYRTPGAYLSAAKALPAGPARERAMRSAALAFATAAAAERGDMRLVRSGMRGLGMLGVAAGANTALENEAKSLAAPGSLEAALRAANVPAETIATISMVRGILDTAGDAVSLLIQAISDPGVKTALRWFVFVLTGRNPPGMSDDDVRVLADFCQGSAFLDNRDDVAGITDSIGRVLGRFIGGDTAKKATEFISAFLAFVAVFRSRLCSSTRIAEAIARRTSSSSTPPQEAAAQEEAIRIAQAARAAARTAPTPQQLAVNNLRQALLARATYENLGPSITSVPWGRGTRYSRAQFDCFTSSLLLTASQAYAALFPGTSLPGIGRFRITAPEGYINTPPSASCPPPGSGGGGGGGGASSGGGGGGVAAAAAGAGLIAWLFFR